LQLREHGKVVHCITRYADAATQIQRPQLRERYKVVHSITR
jgi:hypothetical protein